MTSLANIVGPRPENWADPQRTDLSAVGFDSAPPLTWWQKVAALSAVAAGCLFALAWLWPH